MGHGIIHELLNGFVLALFKKVPTLDGGALDAQPATDAHIGAEEPSSLNSHGCGRAELQFQGFWSVCFGFFLIFDIQNNGRIAAAIGIIGVVLGWIFQERVKGVAAFIHLRSHHLLNIGDWIKVPRLNVDGTVKRVTLTTVTLCNWDTTTSTIPISTLQSDHFINLQNMADGKTYGRRMQKMFTIDMASFRPIKKKDIELFESGVHDIHVYLPESEIKPGVLNARLYRLYLYHWLMRNPCVSHMPNLIVRWLDAKECGLVLEIYVFITESSFAAFEWQQSLIIEHVITSLNWFDLRLYQSMSAYYATYNNNETEDE